MNKKLIAIIAITVIIISTVIVTFFGAKAAAGDMNIKVKEIKVYGFFAGEARKEYISEKGIIVIEVKKNAQYFQLDCSVVPSDATYPKLVFVSNSEYYDVNDSGLVSIKDATKSGDITISNRDSGVKVVVRFVLEGKGDGTIVSPW